MPRPDMRRLGQFFARASFAGLDRPALLNKFLEQGIGLFNGAGALYLHEEGDGIRPETVLFSRQLQEHAQQLTSQLRTAAEKALAQKELQTASLDASGTLHGILCPLSMDRGCLCLLLVATWEDLPPFLLGLQLLALLLDQYLAGETAPQQLHQNLLARLPGMLALPPGREQCIFFNQILKEASGTGVTALARARRTKTTELIALSDVVRPDRRTEKARLLRKGLEECMLRKTPLHWPATQGTPSPILAEICRDYGMEHGLILPLHEQDGIIQGALLLLWEKGPEPDELHRAMAPVLPICTTLLARSSSDGKQKTGPSSSQPQAAQRLHTRVILAVAAVLLLLRLAPIPYRINAKGLGRPKITRYVVARYNGILKESLVRPGDRVNKGEILARLDGRETETRLAALRAERDKAKKLFDQATARGNTAAAQLARLDMLRYEEQLKEVLDQQRHLIIRSPVSGMVLSGDLQRAEGSPVNRGQTLFEVAPLEAMEVEVAIPEEDIAQVPEHAAVRLRFAAYPDQAWSGRFVRIEPKARIQENTNVFIGILELDNRDERLHPGMRTRAKIKTGTRLLAWILLRKPWHTLQSLADSLFAR